MSYESTGRGTGYGLPTLRRKSPPHPYSIAGWLRKCPTCGVTGYKRVSNLGDKRLTGWCRRGHPYTVTDLNL